MSAVPAGSEVSADRVVTLWESSPSCDGGDLCDEGVVEFPLTSIPDAGTPICAGCGMDLVLLPTVRIV